MESLPRRPGDRVLDLGCGFGATTCELAAIGPIQVVGVDPDRPVLDVGRRAAAACGSEAEFVPGDAYCLPFAAQSFDLVFCRFVFQHLADPGAAAAEVRRVLQPGGTVCVLDVDDGLSISHPPATEAFERLAGALRASQAAAGGDRRIGRKMAGILDRAGLEPGQVLVLAQAAYHRPQPGGPERTLLLERLRSARAAIVGGGHMDGSDFDADLSALGAEEPGPTCEIEAQMAVLATRR